MPAAARGRSLSQRFDGRHAFHEPAAPQIPHGRRRACPSPGPRGGCTGRGSPRRLPRRLQRLAPGRRRRRDLMHRWRCGDDPWSPRSRPAARRRTVAATDVRRQLGHRAISATGFSRPVVVCLHPATSGARRTRAHRGAPASRCRRTTRPGSVGARSAPSVAVDAVVTERAARTATRPPDERSRTVKSTALQSPAAGSHQPLATAAPT